MADLPRNVRTIRDVLDAAGGPVAATDLRSRLAAVGVIYPEPQLRKLPENYPEVFELTAADELVLVRNTKSSSGRVRPSVAVDDLDPWWTASPSVEPLPLGNVLVVGEDGAYWLDRPTVGLSAGRLDDDRLCALLDEAEAVCGAGIHLMLRELVERTDEQLPDGLLLLELHELSVLLWPDLVDRSLNGMARAAGCSDPSTTAQVVAAMAATWDPSDPTFNLAHRLLVRCGLPWSRLLPAAPVPEDLHGVVRSVPDPLVRMEAPAPAASARTAVDAAFVGLAAAIPDYRPRQGQREMADAVARSLDGSQRLIVEAPTGTGKSLAYLAPAAGRATTTPVVVSTNTKMLQSQLRSDAQRLRDLGVLNVPFRELRGVGNYVCAREVTDALHRDELSEGGWLAVAVGLRALAATTSGTWDDVSDFPLRRAGRGYAAARSSLATTSLMCTRTECAWAEVCPMMDRLNGIDAKPGIVAANHALVAAWTAGDEPTAPGGLLDKPTSLVFDEAHTLEDALASAWSDQTGAHRLSSLIGWLNGRNGPVRRAIRELARRSQDTPLLDEVLGQLEDASSEVERLGEHVAVVQHEYGGVARSVVLQPFQQNWPPFRKLSYAATDTARSFDVLRMKLAAALGDLQHLPEKARPPLARGLLAASKSVEEQVGVLLALGGPTAPHRFLEVLDLDDEAGETAEDLALCWTYERTPLQISALFPEHVLQHARSVVLTSATLTVDGSFRFVGDRLGLRLSSSVEDPTSQHFDELQLTSPFDHDCNSLVVLTNHLPVPTPVNEQEFVQDVAADQVGFLSLSGGKSLVLLNSRERMHEVVRLVRTKEDELAERDVSVLMQGESGPAEIAARFRNDHGTALYGLRSYWAGFDAPGETLSYLFVEKPPYPHPEDPLQQARQRLVREAGGDSFMDYVVPTTAVSLSQGVGRLIRHETDRGAVVMYDRRMLQPTSANHQLLSTLPTSNFVEAVDRDDAWTRAINFVTGEEPDLSSAILLISDAVGSKLEELQLVEGGDYEAGLRLAAKELFGIDELHDSQLALMLAVLEGRDALGLLPTGRGKSLCFQLPALVHPRQEPFIVVSPLVALIKDQVDDLRARRGLRAVAGITNRTSAVERSEIMRDLATGRTRLVYVSPERLVRDPVLRQALAEVTLGAAVVDEAHCVSAWGHDFRPEFRQISKALATFPRSPRLALTATAPPEVERDIVATLDMEDPLVVREPTDRPDLQYWRRPLRSDRERTREMLRFLMAQEGRPGIVYASLRAETERLTWVLTNSGFTARAYHAGLLPEQRESAQEDFLSGNVQVIVATKAFGMGVNKPDIGWVLHYDLPESLEAYVQEAGRAARAPGVTATVGLLWTGGDIARRRRQLSGDAAFASPETAQRFLDLLAHQDRRGDDVLVDPEDVGATLGIEPDELNVLVAWLEQAGAVERLPDCTVRGAITVGRTLPDDPEERLRFVDLLKARLKCRMGTRRLVDLAEAADTCSADVDELERDLIRWSLDRHMSFQSTQRRWRLQMLSERVDRHALGAIEAAWRQLQTERLSAMVEFAERATCRRVVIAEKFGDRPRTCAESGGLECDACAGTAPPWHSVDIASVPDPEQFVDVDLVVLQIIGWASRNTVRPYSEKTLRSVALGNESYSGSAMRCPQFGVLRHVRAGQRRFDEAVEALLKNDMVERFSVEYQGSTWSSIRATEAGLRELGISNVA